MSTQPTAPTPGTDPAPLPFVGLRVLDLSQGLAGPYCAMLLAQHGAEVVKLEPPEGDWSRAIGTRHGSHSAIDLMANRGKHSLALDMKAPGGVDAVLRIAAQCDVVIEGFRPGVSERLGLGYAQVRDRNPGVVYLSVSGFGQAGANAPLPATDTVMQGFSGMMTLNADGAGTPRRLGFLAVDTLTALYAFQAVSAALYGRLRGGPGQYLDVSLMQATAAFLAPKIVEASLEGEHPVALNVPAGVYRTADGWLAITLSKEAHYAALCKAVERIDLAQDPSFGSFVQRAPHAHYLQTEIGAALLQRTTAGWLEHLSRHGVVAARINSITDWLADDHVRATAAAPEVRTEGTQAFRFPRIPGVQPGPAEDARSRWPGIGDHGADVLRRFGFTEAEIDTIVSPTSTKEGDKPHATH